MKRNEVLPKALEAFIHYGFRKATMDDVAAAVGMSRPGLYKAFGSKAQLFRTTIEHSAEVSMRGAEEAMSDETLPLEERLIRAFDSWSGRHVDSLRSSPHAMEVIATIETQLGDETEQNLRVKIDRLAALIEDFGPRTSNGTPEEIAETLIAVDKGLVHTAANRHEFLRRMRVAIRLVI